MPLSGPFVSSQIQDAYRQAQRALADARAQAAATGDAIQTLASDRDHTLESLAEHYLPNLTRDSLQQVWQEARRTIEHILLRKEEHAARIDDRVSQLDQQRDQAAANLEKSNVELDQLLDEQQTLSERLAAMLVDDPQFKQLSDRAAEAEAALERAEASLAEIEQDAAQKLPAYEKSKLFMYLWNRGMATPRYTSRGVTRRMDRWVSRLIDYPKAKAGFEYLKNTPQQVRNLVEKDRQALEVVLGELERQRDAMSEKIGLSVVVAKVTAADVAHHQIIDSIEALDQSLQQARSELSEVEDPRGTYYQEAIEYLKSLLQKTEQETLENRARQTPDPRDDQMVARLEHLNTQFRQVNTEAAARQQRIEWLDRHLAAVSQFHHRFRAAGFDSSRSYFDDSLNLAGDLSLALEGRDSVDTIWQRMQQRQRFAPSSLETAGSTITRAAGHPLTQVLIHAMAHAASHALSDHARRAGGRRSSSSSSGSSRSRSSSRSSSSGGSASRSGGGFQTRNKI